MIPISRVLCWNVFTAAPFSIHCRVTAVATTSYPEICPLLPLD